MVRMGTEARGATRVWPARAHRDDSTRDEVSPGRSLSNTTWQCIPASPGRWLDPAATVIAPSVAGLAVAAGMPLMAVTMTATTIRVRSLGTCGSFSHGG